MSAAAMTEHGLDDETLAAFVDGKLNESERAAVIDHLASCGECRSKAIDAGEIAEMMQGDGNVAQFPGTRKWVWILAAAAAAVIAVVLLGPMRKSVFDEPGIPKLIAASNELQYRKTYGRLSGGFPYKQTNFVRGAGDRPAVSDDVLPFYRYAGEIHNGKDLHARGVLALLMNDRKGAIVTLRKALQSDPANRTIAQDLAVTLLHSGSKAEIEESLEISNRLWAQEKTPEVAWNRAYALDHLQRYKEAVAAWDDYLELDRASEWAAEATRERASMQEMADLDTD